MCLDWSLFLKKTLWFQKETGFYFTNTCFVLLISFSQQAAFSISSVKLGSSQPVWMITLTIMCKHDALKDFSILQRFHPFLPLPVSLWVMCLASLKKTLTMFSNKKFSHIWWWFKTSTWKCGLYGELICDPPPSHPRTTTLCTPPPTSSFSYFCFCFLLESCVRVQVENISRMGPEHILLSLCCLVLENFSFTHMSHSSSQELLMLLHFNCRQTDTHIQTLSLYLH